jgi:hypothetical protein
MIPDSGKLLLVFWLGCSVEDRHGEPAADRRPATRGYRRSPCGIGPMMAPLRMALASSRVRLARRCRCKLPRGGWRESPGRSPSPGARAAAAEPPRTVGACGRGGQPQDRPGICGRGGGGGLARHGGLVPYRTLHRFCVERRGFGRTAATVRVAFCRGSSPSDVRVRETRLRGYGVKSSALAVTLIFLLFCV